MHKIATADEAKALVPHPPRARSALHWRGACGPLAIQETYSSRPCAAAQAPMGCRAAVTSAFGTRQSPRAADGRTAAAHHLLRACSRALGAAQPLKCMCCRTMPATLPLGSSAWAWGREGGWNQFNLLGQTLDCVRPTLHHTGKEAHFFPEHLQRYQVEINILLFDLGQELAHLGGDVELPVLVGMAVRLQLLPKPRLVHREVGGPFLLETDRALQFAADASCFRSLARDPVAELLGRAYQVLARLQHLHSQPLLRCFLVPEGLDVDLRLPMRTLLAAPELEERMDELGLVALFARRVIESGVAKVVLRIEL
mmetsp:Transcript_17833/g.51862  ORF Transcript_17833/g.51862 Transcript_17833/m.51862 type:complete len:312 (+) Transcript_17833:153-1088(+)